MVQRRATSQDWRTPNVDALLTAIVQLDDRDEAARFFRDLCTLGELHDLGQRWAVVRMLDQGLHYAEISRLTGASTATITTSGTSRTYGTTRSTRYRHPCDQYMPDESLASAVLGTSVPK